MGVQGIGSNPQALAALQRQRGGVRAGGAQQQIQSPQQAKQLIESMLAQINQARRGANKDQRKQLDSLQQQFTQLRNQLNTVA